MNRYRARFAELKKKNEGAFVPFVTLGDPHFSASKKIVKKLVEGGADILELGLPFSDPIADGKTIQAAAQRALQAGMNTDLAFQLVAGVRALDARIPIGLLVYGNLVNARGIDRFYRDAKKAGVDGILIADLPLEEAKPFLRAARKHGVNQIFLVAPTTTSVRLSKIVRRASGFVYVVSVLGVTGARKELKKETVALVKRIRRFTSLPLCVGFGLSKPSHIQQVVRVGADGAIVGSAVVQIIERNLGNEKKMLAEIGEFVLKMKKATRC